MYSVPEVTEAQDRGPAAHIAEFIGTLLLVSVLAPVVGALISGFAYLKLIHAPGQRGPGAAEPVG